MLDDPAAQSTWSTWAVGHSGDSASVRKQLDAGNMAEAQLRALMDHYNDENNVFTCPSIDPMSGVTSDEINDVDPNKFTKISELHAFRDFLGGVRSVVTIMFTKYTASGQNGDKPARDFLDKIIKTAKNMTATGLLFAHNCLYSSASLHFFVRTLPADVRRTLGLTETGGEVAVKGDNAKRLRRQNFAHPLFAKIAVARPKAVLL